MKFFNVVFVISLLLVPSCFAHMYLSSLTIGGTALKEGDCVRMTGTNSPIVSVTSSDLTCGFKPNADKSANRKCPVEAGSEVGLQWYHNGPSPSDDIVDPSHQGPCIVYMAKLSDNPSWFKIYENGFDENTKKFCVATLIANRGLLKVTIPSDIAPGDYLLRGEVIALHESNRMDGAQFYVNCAEITVTGKGKASPSTVSLPGAYKNTDPGIYIPNYYNAPMTSYVIPGPAVYKSGGKSSDGDNETGSSGKKSSGGMSPGGAAALVIFLLAFVGIIAFGAFYYHRNGHVFGKSSSTLDTILHPRSSASAPRATDRRQDSNYVAYVEKN